jgi:uncharacterized membrane protein
MRARGMFTGIALGAGLAYFLDPERGAERRRKWREGLEKALEGLEPGADRDLRGIGPVGVLRYGSRLGDIAGLEAGSLLHPGSSRRVPDLLLRATGGALTLFGLSRRGTVATAARTIGAGMLAAKAAGAARRAERRRTVDIQKTIHIDAPPEQVYAFWSSYRNFPLFMSNVREIQDLGSGRTRWLVSGPGGVPIEWQAVLTENIPGELIAWRSEPGSMLENAGVVRFRPEDGGTRVDLRFCYQPPAGGAGQAVTDLLGADPRAKLNEDLGRLKTLLERTTRSEIHGQESGA